MGGLQNLHLLTKACEEVFEDLAMTPQRGAHTDDVDIQLFVDNIHRLIDLILPDQRESYSFMLTLSKLYSVADH